MNTRILRPYIISAVFVAAWTVCGWLFRLGPVSYSLIGMPFVVVFQLVICRRRLHQLWVRDAMSFHLDRTGIMLAIAIIAGNAAMFWRFLLPWHAWGALFLLLLIIGSVGVAYALRQQRADKFKQALPSFAIAVLIGCAITVIHAVASKHSPTLSPSGLVMLLKSFVRLLPDVFICDEVVFRGLLDSYVAPSTGSRRQGWTSAIFISALWGIWHMWHSRVFLDFAGTLALGVALSFCWRKNGTLLLPGVAHALLDAYRDTILY
jgi:membrane protease YdiL (CAAX protease family)